MKKDTITAIFRDLHEKSAWDYRDENSTCLGENELLQLFGNTIKRLNNLGKKLGYSFETAPAALGSNKSHIQLVLWYNGRRKYRTDGRVRLATNADAGAFVRAMFAISQRDDLLNKSPQDDDYQSVMAGFMLDYYK